MSTKPYALAPRIDALAALTIDQVEAAMTWVNRDGAPRDECFMSTVERSYTYGRGRGERTYDPIPYTELINDIRGQVSALVAFEYEACFANWYADHLGHLGWHADDSPGIDHSHPIAVLSFGAPRELWVRPNPIAGAPPPDIDKVLLPHGSLLVMAAGMQQSHQHRIPKNPSPCAKRISLTFRKLVP